MTFISLKTDIGCKTVFEKIYSNTKNFARRSEYPGKLIEKLRELRQDEQLCDLELYSSVDSEPILAHKYVFTYKVDP